MLRFDRFRYDRVNQRLEDDAGKVVRLNPKAFDVLAVLIERRGELVSKEQLLDTVWPDAHVTDGVLKVCVAELRRALGDSVSKPRVIETVHRRGYRFVAPVSDVGEASGAVARADVAPPREPAAVDAAPTVGAVRSSSSGVVAPTAGAGVASIVAWPAAGVTSTRAAAALVGREAESAVLEQRLRRMLAGERQIVFVTGEAGGGKTALVEAFVADVAQREPVAIIGSQCLETFGSAEAYMPVLEGIARLAREDVAARPMLRRYAPTWFAQIPWLVEDDDRERLGRELLSGARERMLREMAEFVEAYTAITPLIGVYEDVHWADPSTIDLLSLIAGRRERARMLLILTFRPAELVLSQHPLRAVSQKLTTSRLATEVALDDLSVAAVGEYLERRFEGSRLPAELPRLVRERTDGNPLFVVTLVDHLLARGALVERDGQWWAAQNLRSELAAVPESLRRLIEQQVERLGAEDRQLLEAASLVGTEFPAAAAAGGAGRDVADAEERFERLMAAGRLLRRVGVTAWPDGTITTVFAFRHALYRDALAAAVPSRRRVTLHLQIATVLERAHGEKAGDLAAELAVHFEEARDRKRAIQYRRLAAQTANSRHAIAEAEAHLERGLALLAELPPSPERDQEELALLSMIGPVRMATGGFASPEVEKAYKRALELSSGAPQGPALFPMLWGLWVFYAVSGQLNRALELGRRNLAIAEESGDRLLRLEAHHAMWTTHIFRGELREALHHLDQGEPLYDPVADRLTALVYGNDPKAAALGYRALVMWMMGYVDTAVRLSEEGIAHARGIGHPMSIAQALVFAAWVRLCRREPEPARKLAEEAIAYCNEQNLPFWLPNGLQIRGWALIEQDQVDEGLAEWERGVELWNVVRGSLGRTAYDAMFAAAKARGGHVAEGRELLERCRALVEATGERYHEAEVSRIAAEMLLAEAGTARKASGRVRVSAQALLKTAVTRARDQSATMFELRAVTALARLNRDEDAHARTTELVTQLAEGCETPDVQEARRLLS